jgi:signal transduction histidine kinase
LLIRGSYRLLSVFSILLVVVFATHTHAQTQQIKDSLKAILSSTNSIQTRVDVLNTLAYEYYDFDDSIGFEYAKKALAEAQRSSYASGEKYAHTMIGVGYFSFGEYARAKTSFRTSSLIAANDDANTAYNLILLGNVLTDIGSFDSAAFYYDTVLTMLQSNQDQNLLPQLYKAYARLKLQRWENEAALDYLRKVDAIGSVTNANSKSDLYAIYANAYLNMRNFDKATEYNERLFSIVADIDDNFHKVLCYLTRAEISYAKGNFQKALLSCFQGLELSKIYGYHLIRAQLYLTIGEIYCELSEYKLASEFLYKGLGVSEKAGMQPLTATLYAELAWMYKDQHNFTLALQYVNRSQAIRKELKDIKGVANCHNTRGLIYMLQGLHSASIQEHTYAKQLREQIGYKEGISASLFNLALAYEEQGDLSKALKLELEALEIDKQVGNKQSLAISYDGIATLYIKLKQLNKAEEFLQKAYALSREIGSKILIRDSYRNFALLYEAKHDYKKSLQYHKLFQTVNDSIYSESNSMKVAEMNALYEVERKETQIELLNNQRELSENRMANQASQIKNQTWIIVIGSILLVAVAMFTFFTVRLNRQLTNIKHELSDSNEELLTQSEELREANQSLSTLNNELIEKQEEIQAQAEELTESNNTLHLLNIDLQEKQNEVEAQSEELREANEIISSINKTLEQRVDERTQLLRQAYTELDTFFYRSSHDFRRPITTFMGLAEVAKITVKDENALDLFEKVSETAHNLDKMLRKLQSISDIGAQELMYKDVLLREMIEKILLDFQPELDAKGISVTQNIQLSKPFYSYAALVKIIIENIVENSIHFNSLEHPSIKINAWQSSEILTLTLEDNGQGIPEEYHRRIFDMYFRANIASKGNGLGLYIVKKAVDKLGGTIRFESKQHEGALFTVELPMVSS